MGKFFLNECNETFGEIDSKTPVEFSIKWYKLIFDFILLLILIIFGTIGNICSFVVLFKAKQLSQSSRSTTLFLQWLSLCDCFLLLSSLSFRVIENLPITIGFDSPFLKSYHPLILPATFYIGHTSRMMRNWIVVLVSMERWIAITWPLKAPIICNVHKAKVAIIILLIISTIYNLPRIYQAFPQYIPTCVGGKITMRLKNDDNKFPILWEKLYLVVGYMIVIIAGPFAILIVLNSLLISSLRKASKGQKVLIAQQDRPRANSVEIGCISPSLSNIEQITSESTESIPVLKQNLQSTAQRFELDTVFDEEENDGNSNVAHKDACAAKKTIEKKQTSQKRHNYKSRLISQQETRERNMRAAHRLRIGSDPGNSITSDGNHKGNYNASVLRRRPMSKLRMEITRMCIGIIIVYICCELPALVHKLLVYSNWEIPYIIIAHVNPITNLLVINLSSINFIIYILLGSRFRAIFFQIIVCDQRGYSHSPANQRNSIFANSRQSTLRRGQFHQESAKKGLTYQLAAFERRSTFPICRNK